MRDALGGVNYDGGVEFVGKGDYFFEIDNFTGGVGEGGDGDEFCLRGEKFFVGIEIESEVVGEGYFFNVGVFFCGKIEPRKVVGMVLEGAENDLIVGFYVFFAPCCGYEVDGFCGAAGEYYFGTFFGIDEIFDGFAG